MIEDWDFVMKDGDMAVLEPLREHFTFFISGWKQHVEVI